ncbi:hypothetical protein SCUP234_09516 [Seiridium cupressi]
MPRVKAATKRSPAKKRTTASKKASRAQPLDLETPASSGRNRGIRRTVELAAADVNTDHQPRGRRGRKAQPEQQLGGLKLEAQPPVHHRVAALIGAAWPGKRRASNDWDDRIIKRRRTSLVSLPWESERETRLNQHGQELEKPGYTMHDLLGSSDFDNQLTLMDRVSLGRIHGADDPIAAMGLFTKVPTEVRDMIFRHLLVHHRDIRVLRGWSLVFPRSRPNLEANVLRVCRVFYRQGLRILYGENTFVYLVRDPSSWRTDTDIVVKHVYDRGHVPIDKHKHMIRRIKVIVEANRMRLHDSRVNLPIALQKFLPDQGGLGTPAQLHTVTIELPVQTRAMLRMKHDTGTNSTDVPVCSWFRQGSTVLQALKNLNCQFIRILAYTQDNEYFEAWLDRRPHFSQLSADEGNFDTWSTDSIMLATRHAEAKKSRARLNTLYYWLEELAGGLQERHLRQGMRRDPRRAVLDGPFRYHVPRPDIADPLEALPSGSSTRSNERGVHVPVNYSGLTANFLDDSDLDGSAMGSGSSDDGYDESGEGEDDDESFFVSKRRARPTKFIGAKILDRI